MKVSALLNHLDSDNGSFYDPFRWEVNPTKQTKENIGGMIESALDTHSEFRDTDTGKPTGFSLSAAKFLKRYRSDAEYRNAVIDAVTNEAIKVAEEWKQKDE